MFDSALLEKGKKKVLNIHKGRRVLVKHCYYIVDLYYILKPKYLIISFDTKREARAAIAGGLDGDFERFYVTTGGEIAKYNIPAYRRYLRKEVSRNRAHLKYDYPPERTTHQQRKDFRTLARKRLREKWLNI